MDFTLKGLNLRKLIITTPTQLRSMIIKVEPKEVYELFVRAIKEDKIVFTSSNNDFKTKLEKIYTACNDERVFEIQNRIADLLKEISS